MKKVILQNVRDVLNDFSIFFGVKHPDLSYATPILWEGECPSELCEGTRIQIHIPSLLQVHEFRSYMKELVNSKRYMNLKGNESERYMDLRMNLKGYECINEAQEKCTNML